MSLPDYARERNVNETILQQLPAVFADIESWGGKRKSDQTFGNYLETEKKMSKTSLKQVFSDSEMPKLKHTTFDGLDVTFSCSLLPLLCDKIHANSDNKDENRMECQLNKLRKLRNQVMHEPEGRAVDPNVATEIEEIAEKLLDIAGKMYKIEDDEVEEEKSKAKKIISDAKDMVYIIAIILY